MVQGADVRNARVPLDLPVTGTILDTPLTFLMTFHLNRVTAIAFQTILSEDRPTGVA